MDEGYVWLGFFVFWALFIVGMVLLDRWHRRMAWRRASRYARKVVYGEGEPWTRD